MSMIECDWAMRQQNVASRSKFVLLVLANASNDFVADYSLSYLAKGTLLSEKACELALGGLIRAGCIKYLETTWNFQRQAWSHKAYLNEGRYE